jgi:signal transduction histidine kinase
MRSAAMGSCSIVPADKPDATKNAQTLLARELARAGTNIRPADDVRGLLATERFFVHRIEDEEARATIRAARRRIESFGAPSDEASSANILAFAGEAFGVCALECGWGADEAAELAVELGRLLREPVASTGAGLFLSASRNPQLLELPPRVAVKLQLDLIRAFAPVEAVSLWTRDTDGRLTCVVSVGPETRTMRKVAKRILEGTSRRELGRRTIVGVPVLRWDRPWAALVARQRTEDRVRPEGYLRGAATTISPIIERDMLLQRSTARERALVEAAEKRLLRLGFDLHDGPLQDLAALADDVRLARSQLVPLVSADVRELADGRFDDFNSRLESIDRKLRELSHSLESSSAVAGSMERVLEREVESFRNDTGITVRHRIRGNFASMTRSQKLALFRILQEALSNVREHSSATDVELDVVAKPDRIEARLADNGTGFEISETLFDAARRGRLGLVGMGERARLLAGKLDVQSRVGGPTVVVLTLPRLHTIESVAAASAAAV